MEHLTMHSVDGVTQNVERIAALFPNCVTERKDENGKVERAIDFDLLRQELCRDIIETGEERYQFTWPGKREAIRLANAPTNCTLRPVRDDSVDFDDTQNLYIEGDNLEVLKLLRETYLGKVKMIYIDPPYNTGNDFVYEDDFAQSYEDFKGKSGMFDEDGNMLLDNYERNNESNGRFHTDWLNLMYPRLKVARDLLAEDGAIFISMDENEIGNLEKIGNEIFGERNLIGKIIWERAFAPKNDAKFFSDSHDYVIVYARNINSFTIGLLPRTEEANSRYKNPDNDPKGPWSADNMTVKTYSAAYDYEITTPNGTIMSPPNGRCWFTSKERMLKLIEEGKVWFGENGGNMPRLKRYLSDVQQGMTPITIWKYSEVGHNQEGRQELKQLFNGKGYFDGPKPLRLLNRILTIANTQSDSIIIDFFSGSATTAHAVMQLNAEDGGNRKFIMVQLPEVTDENSEARKAGYANICEIGKERIRRAGKKIKAEHPEAKDLDIGFRVLRLDSSNMEDVYYTPDKFDPTTLTGLLDNVKPDRTDEDLLFQVMLELDIPLSASIVVEQLAGKRVFNVSDGHIIATFDKDVNESTVTEIAKRKPNFFIMRDASAANDNVLDNFEQIFRHYSPDTICKIL